jgi:ADP-heptose:LPS heptosyltransferase
VKKALVIRLSSAGDILITNKLIAGLKQSGYQVHLLCKEKFSQAGMAAGADRVIKYPSSMLSAASILSRENYDAVVDLQDNLRSFLLKVLVKSGYTKVYNKDTVRRRLMVLFKWFLKDTKSVSEKYLEAAAGLTPGDNAVKKKSKSSLRKKPVINVLIHDGARWKNKRWPYFKELVKGLLKLKKVRVTLTGVKDEVDNYSPLLYHKDRRVRDLTGKTDFTGLLKEIRGADVFVGNDTAAAHAARLYEKPALIFLGPTVQAFGFITEKDFIIMENRELMCRPCDLHGGDKCPIGSFDCMKSIPPSEALQKIKKIIS